ncbi:MAG: 4'-phosphopantetheinyl transferase superfamily protein [Clostridia bacterium]|nr:4'-phosphopantetheinyl transferase superfamily protein [Clostridia bacterium]
MVTIFLAKTPSKITGEIYCKARLNEIASCTNEKVKKQKFYAWALLEKCAISLGYELDKLHFFKLDIGKWKCDKFEFSLSHSDDFVAVAISDIPVGIDLQKDTNINCDTLAKRILTVGENLEYIELGEDKKQRYLLEKWTQKESIYKMLELNDLKISKINCSNYPINTIELILDGDTYYLSYAPFEKDTCVNLIKI